MNQTIIAVAIIMLPGIISSVICDKIIIHHPKWDYFKFSLYSFVLGIATYILLQIILFVFDIFFSTLFSLENISWSRLIVWNFIFDCNSKLSLFEVFQATSLSMPVAFFASWCVHFKFFTKAAQILKISNKYGDENLFSFYLNAKEIDWVYIRDIENNLTYEGQVLSFSENDNIQEIVLSNVTIYSYKDSVKYYSVPSIYLCKKIGSMIIEAVPSELLEVDNDQEIAETVA